MLRGIFLMAQPLLLREEGNTRLPLVDSFTPSLARDYVRRAEPERYERDDIRQQSHQQGRRDTPERRDDEGQHRRNDRKSAINSPIPGSRGAVMGRHRLLDAQRESHTHEEAGWKKQHRRNRNPQRRRSRCELIGHSRTRKDKRREQKRQKPDPSTGAIRTQASQARRDQKNKQHDR